MLTSWILFGYTKEPAQFMWLVFQYSSNFGMQISYIKKKAECH